MADDSIGKIVDSRPSCKYGSDCYRKNPKHRERFRHPPKTEKEENDEPLPKIKKISDENGTTQSSETTIEYYDSCGSDEDSKNADEESLPHSPIDVKANIKQKFLVEMPPDFYSLWEFCKSLSPFKPQDALNTTLGVKLVGPFDVLSGKLKSVSNRKSSSYLQHWRFYYDPPEFQTVLIGNLDSQFHIGYFRDDPNEMPIFLTSNAVSEGCAFKVVGPNLFAAINTLMKEEIKKKNKEATRSVQLLQSKLEKWAAKDKITLDLKTTEMKNREKKVVTKSFHRLGLVVPYDKKTEVGYRPLPETDANLKKILQKIASSKSDSERDKNFDGLQTLITLVQFANDECDCGMGLELGMDVFCFGDPSLDSTASGLLSIAYELLGREVYSKILQAHLQNRKKSGNLSVIA